VLQADIGAIAIPTIAKQRAALRMRGQPKEDCVTETPHDFVKRSRFIAALSFNNQAVTHEPWPTSLNAQNTLL
jgi:hypothetical protein